jgi:Bacteriophage tail sheath protein
MATTYLSPGVYVEEIPSAQQPINGVGTNTVGFIGIVPDVISCPVPISDHEYHKRLLDKENELRKVKKEDIQNTLNKAIADVKANEGKLAVLQKQISDAKLKADASDAEKQQFADDQQKKRNDLQKLNQDLTSRRAQRDKAQDDLNNFDDLRTRAQTSVKRYDLVNFRVQAEVADSKLCTNFNEYIKPFGPVAREDGQVLAEIPVPFSADDPEKTPGTAMNPGHRALTHAVNGFFKNGGTRCFVARVSSYNSDEIERALKDFKSIDAIAIVAAPGVMPDDGGDLKTVWDMLVTHCEVCKDRFAILDSPPDVEDAQGNIDMDLLSYDNEKNVLPQRNKNAAYYFPWLEVIDPAKQFQDQDRGVPAKHQGKVYVPPSGHVAGIYARTDEERGVHKAPANCAVLGALDLKYYISKEEQELLNPQGVNCIRTLNGNITLWGARTIGGDMNPEWKYVNVRRLFLFLAESIDEGTQWVVFEPNDQALWGKIRRNVSAFLTNVWRSGALFGSTPEEAFYVKCDAELNSPEVRDVGQVIIEIGVAIVCPAEFVIFRITQSTEPRTK